MVTTRIWPYTVTDSLIFIIKYFSTVKYTFDEWLRANLSLCLTNISVLIVSGFKLARRNEIVSLPPEKMRSQILEHVHTSQMK